MDEDVQINYRECEGLKGGKLYTNGDGYFYSLNVNKGDYKHLLCKTKACRGSAKITRTFNGMDLVSCTVHSVGCEPDFMFERSIELRKKILQRCQNETVSLATIFKDEYDREEPEVADTISYSQILSAMKRARRKRMPPIPSSYGEYLQLLVSRFQDESETAYSCQHIGEGVTEAVVFFSDPVSQILNNAEEVHFDGTFKILPDIPASKQLFMVLAMKNDHAFPVVFALMKSKTTDAYCIVLECIKSKFPEMSPKLIISDYDKNMKAAVQKVFPLSIHKGCWFHFTQSILQKVQREGLLNVYNENEMVKKTVRMLMVLALMPHHGIVSAFNDVIVFAAVQNIDQIMDPIFTYFRWQWIENVGCSSFSVYGQPRRTNNSVESLHRFLFSSIGKVNPNIWEFTGAIRGVASSAVRDHLQLETHGPAALARKRRWVLRRWVLEDKAIYTAQTGLVLEQVLPIDFLATTSYRISSHGPLATIGDDVDEDLVPLADELGNHIISLTDFGEQDELSNDVGLRGRGRGRSRGTARGRKVRGRGRGIPQPINQVLPQVIVLDGNLETAMEAQHASTNLLAVMSN